MPALAFTVGNLQALVDMLDRVEALTEREHTVRALVVRANDNALFDKEATGPAPPPAVGKGQAQERTA